MMMNLKGVDVIAHNDLLRSEIGHGPAAFQSPMRHGDREMELLDLVVDGIEMDLLSNHEMVPGPLTRNVRGETLDHHFPDETKARNLVVAIEVDLHSSRVMMPEVR